METGARLDDAMAKAWPSPAEVTGGGWTLRYAEGVTRRANSVLTVGQPADLAAAIAVAEGFYERRNASPVFLVSDASTPSEVRAELAKRGYVEHASTRIMHRNVNSSSPNPTPGSQWKVDESGVFTDEWFDAYWAVEAARQGPVAAQVFRDVLLRPASPTRFVTVGAQGSVVSVGQVVVVGDVGCIQCVATVPAGRRRGAGRAVVERLTECAVLLGARSVFAAVVDSNDASLELFASLGYEFSHRYCYLIR